jgi:hypothetical protein
MASFCIHYEQFEGQKWPKKNLCLSKEMQWEESARRMEMQT